MADETTAVREIPFTCTLDCGSRCELVALMRGDELLRIDTPSRPDTVERPRLVPCARGRAHRGQLIARERVRHPLRRLGARGEGHFEAISWDEALDEVAECLTATKRRWGTQAVMHAQGAGAIMGRGLHGASASQRFFSYWGPWTDARGNESNYNASMAATWMLGERINGSDRATLLDSRLILLWGMNPAENHMGPNTAHFIAKARDHGARVILIDPRYTDSGVLADEWVPIRPGTDAALVAAMGHELERNGWVDRSFLDSHTTGYVEYRRYLLGESDGVPKTPVWAETITGVAAPTIRYLARLLGTTHPAAILPGWGPQRTLAGEQAARAFIALACMTGNVGVPGGGLASVGTRSGTWAIGALPRGPFGPLRNVTPGAWARHVLDEGLDPPLRIAYIVASNLINRSPDTRLNIKALHALDTVVVQDPYLTPTAHHADIVLPICTELERPDIALSWGHDDHLFYSPRIVPPVGESRSDYWVFARLAERLGFGRMYTEGRTEQQWLDHLMAHSPLDTATLRRDGILRRDGAPRAALATFRADPDAHPVATRSGRIEISTPQAMRFGLPLIPSHVAPVRDADDGPGGAHPLQLVTPHHKLRSNSCLAGNPWLRDLEPHAVWINPRDAEARGIGAGDAVTVSSSRGMIVVPAKVTSRIMPGVVCVYQGTWHQPGADGHDHGGCANVLTDQGVSPSGGYATHSAWVQVSRRAP